MIPTGWLKYVLFYIAATLIAAAMWPNATNQIVGTSAGLFFVISGALTVFDPERVRADMAKRQVTASSRKSVESSSLTMLRIMGVCFIAGGAYALSKIIPTIWH